MKSKILFFTLLTLLYTAMTVKAQKPVYPKPNSGDQIPFGKKLPPPVLNARDEVMGKAYDQKIKGLTSTTFDTVSKQFIITAPGRTNKLSPAPLSYGKNSPVQAAKPPQNTPTCFRLTKDINTSTGNSDPSNYPVGNPYSFAVLNNISYFTADDGIHGRELWRSDGTPAGTYLVKDINTGEADSDLYGSIIVSNGLLFFSAITADNGWEPWVSDGTESGTHLLMDINIGTNGSNPNQFINVNGSVFFVTSIFSENHQLWKTDGTEAGTILIKDITQAGIGQAIYELAAVNDMAFFIAYTWATGFQLFRSDGTDAGTYVVKETGYYGYGYEFSAPMQLTAYNNKLYFSVDDGTGRRLWTSDGTEAGTGYAAGFNDVFMHQEFQSIYSNSPFFILNDILFISGFTWSEGSGLYKYDASNADGIVLVKDFTPGTDIALVVPVDMRVVNDAIYFKVISSTDYWHDELWITKGETSNTLPVKLFGLGEYIYNFYNSNGAFFFVKYDNINGNELWKSDGTGSGTVLVKDIITGKGSSFPDNLTFCNGKLLFSSVDNTTGRELWSSDGTGAGTSLVKDINSTTTNGSNAGFFYRGLSSTGNGVVFNAYTPSLSAELYKSDGTSAGTVLLNDIATGEDWSYPNGFLFKNNVSYFIGDNAIGTALYRTDGTSAGLKRMTAYINRDNYFVVNFNVTDNGQLFYNLGNRYTGAYELWHSDGTDAGSIILNTNLNYNDYVITIGNTGFFVAGDFVNGFELWKSDGTVAGTKLVKDINPGSNGSYPYSLYAFKNNLYFGAYDGLGFNYSFWKSDGSEKGTVKLKNITPALFNETFVDPAIQVYCISNNKLYFTATDFQTYGAELWVTNGTANGTTMVKDINPYNSSNPNFLTDVNGILYFTADDGIHGNELWSSDGTSKSTKMVKDITPDYSSSSLYNLCSAGGKLYFLNHDYVYFPAYSDKISLWSSDGTANNTNQVTDAGLSGLSDIFNLTPAGNKLFFGAYSHQYGRELYAGDACAPVFTAARTIPTEMAEAEANTIFDAILYPNPAHSSASLQIKGKAKNMVVTIADISGKVIWQKTFANSTQVSLPVEKITAGIYMVTVKTDTESKTIKLVKE